jgi:glutamine synthetase type III
MTEVICVPEIFGCDVFNEATMKQRLPAQVFQAWKHCVTTGSQLQLDVAGLTPQSMVWGLVPNGHTVQAPSPVFPRILSAEEKEKMAAKAAKAAEKAARKAAQQG